MSNQDDRRAAMRAQFEEMNRQQLALNGKNGNGLWQDMTPHLDDIAEMMTPAYPLAETFDPLANIKASVQYFLNSMSAQPPCRCGHSAEAHEHYRRGSECSAPGCDCQRYQP